MNINKTLSSVIKDKSQLGAESSPFCNVMLIDPSIEYKMVEKIEMEDHKRNENKIQNREQKLDIVDDKASQKMGSDKDGGNNQQLAKKKKVLFDDVESINVQYTEIC